MSLKNLYEEIENNRDNFPPHEFGEEWGKISPDSWESIFVKEDNG